MWVRIMYFDSILIRLVGLVVLKVRVIMVILGSFVTLFILLGG